MRKAASVPMSFFSAVRSFDRSGECDSYHPREITRSVTRGPVLRMKGNDPLEKGRIHVVGLSVAGHAEPGSTMG